MLHGSFRARGRTGVVWRCLNRHVDGRQAKEQCAGGDERLQNVQRVFLSQSEYIRSRLGYKGGADEKLAEELHSCHLRRLTRIRCLREQPRHIRSADVDSMLHVSRGADSERRWPCAFSKSIANWPLGSTPSPPGPSERHRAIVPGAALDAGRRPVAASSALAFRAHVVQVALLQISAQSPRRPR